MARYKSSTCLILIAFLSSLASSTILPPLLSTRQTDLYLTEGQTGVVLECNLDIGDDPITYRWLKQYKLVTAELGHAYRTNKKVHLALHSITKFHGGLYECEAANEAGVNAIGIYVHVQPGDVAFHKPSDEMKIETDVILTDIATSLNDVLAEGNCHCDIMFLMHASPDAPEETLDAQANLVYAVAQPIISKDMRAAIMTYSDYVDPKLNFGKGTDQCALRDAFKDLSHQKWSTRIAPVLSSAFKKMKKSDKKCKVIFLQIFGSLGTEGAQEAISKQIIDNGIKLFIFEATKTPVKGVAKMASTRGDGKRHHWRIPLKMWATIVPFMNYMKEELFGCMNQDQDTPGVCVGEGSKCNQTDQCAGIGNGCVQGICRSLQCSSKPGEPGCCTNNGTFWCGDVTGDCKQKGVMCDGRYQCMNGLDEEDCWTAPCPAHMVRCQSSVLCLSLYELCDGEPNCPSAEDEDPNFCRSHNCPVDRPFRCKSGKCIALESVCDGMFRDCEDGDDELLNYCNAHHVCPPSRPFKCDYGVCIPENKVCDGAYNCLDALDEIMCNKSNCPASRPFKCADGKCVEMDYVCNGIVDACSDGTDEFNCDKFVCPASRAFKCRNGKCIDKWLRCDRSDDCGDGTDESSCNYTTSSTHTLRPSTLPGNVTPLPATTPEGPDGSTKACSDLQMHCSSGACLDMSLVCDGRAHCEDGEDEDPETCATFLCPDDRPNRCPNGACTRITVCDGIMDCPDGSDEKICPNTDGTHLEGAETEPEPSPETEPEPEPTSDGDKSSKVEEASPAASSEREAGSATSLSKCSFLASLPLLIISTNWLR